MQSSLRARRESSASGQETGTAAARGSGKRPWFVRLFDRFGSNPSGPSAAAPGTNALLAFPSEAAPRPEPVPVPIADLATKPAQKPGHPLRARLARPALIAGGVIVVAGLAVLLTRLVPLAQFTAAAPRTGNLTIDTRPATSDVLVDGERRGMSPLTLSLTAGPHTITVRAGGAERVVPMTIAPGTDVTYYFEMKAAESALRSGRVSVVTDPPGARVSVDGRPRGASPLTVADLTAEEHRVTVTSDSGSAERTVTVPAGGTTSVMFSLSKVSGPVGGWLSISAPFDVEVAEDEDVIGTSGTSRIMLAAGRHNISLTNRGVGYQEARRIEVTAGKTVTIRIDPPKASVSVNARPWAEITVDGSSVGQTPLANLLVTVGPHEMLFRHPQLGERRQTVMVTSKGPNRVAVDLTK